jgi:hypothetical protein
VTRVLRPARARARLVVVQTLVAACGLGGAATSRAAGEAAGPAPVAAEKLRLVLDLDEAEAARLEAADHWDAACEALATALAPGSGPWGLGLFAEHECATSVPAKLDPATWLLVVRSERDGRGAALRLRLMRHPPGKKETGAKADAATEASVSIDGGAGGLALLADAAVASLVAAQLLDAAPAMGVVTPAMLGDKKRVLLGAAPLASAGGASALPAPPARLLLYRLRYDAARKLYRPTFVAEAKLEGAADEEGAATRAKKRRRPRWRLTSEAPLELDDDAPIFLHATTGRRGRAAQLAPRVRKAVQVKRDERESLAGKLGVLQLGNLVSGAVASGFLGVRYGHSVTAGQVVGKMSIVSALFELRGAPLDGLRLYYDRWPEARESATLGAVSFSGERTVLGWSFGFGPFGPVDRVDVVPKIGRWSIGTKFLVDVGTDEPTAVDFSVNHALSLGIEGGAEAAVGSTLVRGWLARDFGVNPLEKDGTSVTDTRAGLDAFVTGPRLGVAGVPFHLSFLAFTFYEIVSLTRNKAPDGPDEIVVSGIDYNAAYVGGGLALSW